MPPIDANPRNLDDCQRGRVLTNGGVQERKNLADEM